MKIELHKQFKVPVDGLIPLAEEITLKKEKKEVGDKPFTKQAKELESVSALTELPPGSPAAQIKDEEVEEEAPLQDDRKAHKKLVKA